MKFKEFDAVTMTRRGSFELDLPPDNALPLFTVQGEKLWIPILDPVILNGDGYEESAVWVTTHHGHTTYWYVAKYDTESRQARYVRVTPEANAGTVDIAVTANGKGGSTINVTYQLTGLSEAGNKDIESLLNEAAYKNMMQDWQSMINESRAQIEAYFAK